MESQQCSIPPSLFLYPLHPSCIPKTSLKFAQKGSFFIEERTTKSVWSADFCWEMPAGDLLEVSSSSGSGSRNGEKRGMPAWTVGGKGLARMSESICAKLTFWEAGSQGLFEEQGGRTGGPAEKILQKPAQKNRFFPWELKLGGKKWESQI